MRKATIAAIITACALLLGGCQPFGWLMTSPIEDVYDETKYHTEFLDHWRYQQLSTEEQRYYGCLYTAVTDTKGIETYVTYTDGNQQDIQQAGVRVALPGAALSNASIIRIYEAFFADNPQFFYLDRTYSMEGRPSIQGETYYNALLLSYTLPTEQRIQAEQKLQAVVDNVMADCPTEEDEYITEQYLHNQLLSLCTYDMAAAESDTATAPNAYTAYGALVEGKAVCEGYAKAMQLLLQRASIPVTLVTGTAKENNEAHMWNLVTINGESYHLDPTWNDTSEWLQYTFFNLTTDMVSNSCVIEDAETLPLCTAVKDNTFVRNDTVIDTYERQVIAQKIASRMEQGDTVIQLRFTEGKLENGILFLKNKKLMTSMVNEYLEEGNRSMWDYELWADHAQRVLTLIKKA